jgi:hypothetical protein
MRAPAGTVTLEIRLGAEPGPRTRTVHLDAGELKDVLLGDED